MQTEMQIPPDKCGLIIGKGGNTLKQLMQEFNVKLHLVQVFLRKSEGRLLIDFQRNQLKSLEKKNR